MPDETTLGREWMNTARMIHPPNSKKNRPQGEPRKGTGPLGMDGKPMRLSTKER